MHFKYFPDCRWAKGLVHFKNTVNASSITMCIFLIVTFWNLLVGQRFEKLTPEWIKRRKEIAKDTLKYTVHQNGAVIHQIKKCLSCVCRVHICHFSLSFSFVNVEWHTSLYWYGFAWVFHCVWALFRFCDKDWWQRAICNSLLRDPWLISLGAC